jgi:hypothetical protein
LEIGLDAVLAEEVAAPLKPVKAAASAAPSAPGDGQ